MNVSEQGLSNAHFNIPNGFLTKKLQRVKDRHKTDILRNPATLLNLDTPQSNRIATFCEQFKKNCFDLM